MSHVSYDKCVGLVQSRLGPAQTENESNQGHDLILQAIDDISDAPIIGHSQIQFNASQKSKGTNREPEPELRRSHPSRDMRAPNTRISHAKDACAQCWPKCASNV